MGGINQDPSMEDILASIKRVIAEDGRTSPRPPRGTPRIVDTAPPTADVEEDDVLELSDPVVEAEGIMSGDAATASRGALAALAAIRQQPAAAAPEAAVPAGAAAPLEAVVREMLKPMLKDWLDQHLPEIVENLVAREIARITGK
ncbi:hypothetical protein SAMN06295910_1976 [Allosphingosinicella indica]|uniref:DUF2497 domain-containing protein n=2 Tax=Allosphingosinicella indica TaxID=941907 RepID=A0A1X7GKS1_9SPHN|nr:hypothetical protein SAMN06295910_1976 [Allosphingosinicella indica]